MPRAVPNLSNFNAGEWDPRLYGRVDLDRYRAACREMRNMLPLVTGAATRRPGAQFIARSKSDGVARLIPFVFSTVQAYVIEAGAGYFRIFRNGGALETSPGVPLEVANAYTLAELAELQWAQSADVLYIVHPNHPPKRLSRTGALSWTFTDAVWNDGPYLEPRTDLTVTPSGTTGTVTLTASAALFAAGDVGRLIRLRHASTWGWARITAFSSATVVTALVGGAFGATTASVEFRLGAWFTGNYPRSVTFHDGRLWYAGTPQQAQTLWSSASAAFETFTPGAAASDAVVVTINADDMSAIRWIKSARGLLVGTASGEFVVQASRDGETITPSNVTAQRQSTVGAAAGVPAVLVDNAVIYAQRAKRRMFQLSYSFEADGFVSPELSLYASHILRGGVKDMAWQQEPWRVLWVVLDDGLLAALTFMRDQQVIAWHRHPVGGPSAKVLAVATIPSDTADEVWLLVERDYGAGGIRRHVERLAAEYYAEDGARNARFVDAWLAYEGTAANVITGLTHLANQTVSVLADGASHPDVVVSASGEATLQRAASNVVLGFSYVSRVETLDIEAGAVDGTAQTRRRRIGEIGLRFFQSVGGQFGFADDQGDQLERLERRAGSSLMDQPLPPFTGEVVVSFPPRWDRECRVIVSTDQPLPLTLLGIVPRVTANE